jgi:hypothetical protein
MIGDWLNNDTTVAEITTFAEKVYLKQDFGGFKGDPRFIQNTDAQKMFSKLRDSIAGIYVWRMNHATDASEKKRMADEADFAFRQSLALCPYSPEAAFRYTDFLVNQNRGKEAFLVAETAEKMPEMQGQDGVPVRKLVEQLKQYQNSE